MMDGVTLRGPVIIAFPRRTIVSPPSLVDVGEDIVPSQKPFFPPKRMACW